MTWYIRTSRVTTVPVFLDRYIKYVPTVSQNIANTSKYGWLFFAGDQSADEVAARKAALGE